MRFFFLTLIFLFSYILESTLFSLFPVAGVKPDLILIFIVFYSLFRGSKEGVIAGALGGLVQDLLLGNFIGLNTLSKVFVGYLFGMLEKKIYKEHFFVPIVTLALATYVNETIVYVLGLFIQGFPLDYITVLWDIILPMIIYNTCLAPFMYGRFYKSVRRGVLRLPDYNN